MYSPLPIRRFHAQRIHIHLALCCLVLASGCGRSINYSSVEEVSVESSGIQLQESGTVDLATDWPAWRGPHGNGISLSSEAPIQWSESSGISWMSDIPGRGHGSPTIVGDLVLLATADDKAQEQSVMAFERGTGKQLWQTVVHQGDFPSKREVHQKATNANSTVASDGELSFIGFFNGGKVTASALDMKGNISWQRELGNFSSKFGFAPSPVIYKSFVIFAVDNQGGGYLAALDTKSGEIAWRVARPAKNSHSSPIISFTGGRDQLLISGCDEVTSFDPATGAQLWSIAATAETTCGTMVALGSQVFASGGYPESQTICLTSDGEKVWDNRTKIYEPSMLAVDGSLFAVSDSGIAYCWNCENGEELWKKRLGGSFSSSPTYCNGNLYVSDLGGKTHVFKASSKGFESVATNMLGSDCYASPAIVDGQIFMRVGFGQGAQRQERLVCISGT